MIPVQQTVLKHDPDNGQHGDCFRACVCSLLELSIGEVPHFTLLPDDIWWDGFVSYMRGRGYDVHWGKYGLCIEPKDITEFYIITGTSPRGVHHAVIYSDGKLVHDPHPDGSGVVDIVNYIWITIVTGKQIGRAHV